MNNKQSFLLGFMLCMILIGSGVFAVVQYYSNIPITIEKKPSNYVPVENKVYINGGTMNKVSTAGGNGIILEPLQNNETVRTKLITIGNNEDRDITLVWNKSDLPEGLELVITWCINPFNPERTVWEEGSELKISTMQGVTAYITVTDIGLAEGTYVFKVLFTSI